MFVSFSPNAECDDEGLHVPSDTWYAFVENAPKSNTYFLTDAEGDEKECSMYKEGSITMLYHEEENMAYPIEFHIADSKFTPYSAIAL